MLVRIQGRACAPICCCTASPTLDKQSFLTQACASVVDLDVQQVKQLIVGAPGSEVTLGIARPVAHWQRHVAPPDPGADGGAWPQGHI